MALALLMSSSSRLCLGVALAFLYALMGRMVRKSAASRERPGRLVSILPLLARTQADGSPEMLSGA